MNQLHIKIREVAGEFAEDKDAARNIRLNQIEPSLNRKEEVVLDFEGVEGATQSFIHALISDLIRKHGSDVLDVLVFKHCNETIRKIISIVTEYMQES